MHLAGRRENVQLPKREIKPGHFDHHNQLEYRRTFEGLFEFGY